MTMTMQSTGRAAVLALNLTLGLLLGGCVVAVDSPAVAAGSVATETRRFDVTGFDAVTLVVGDNVRVIRGDTVSVIASGDPRALPALALTVDHGTLRIGRRPGRWNDRGAIVTVALPSLRAARITGSGDITVEAAGADFTGVIDGSGSLALRDLRGGDVRIDVAGSGDVVADGAARRLAIRLGGSGDIDTDRLVAHDLTVDLAGSGNVRAQASDTADISLGGSGDVTVAGHPRCAVRKGGSGNVRCG